MFKIFSSVCYGLGFASIALSLFAYMTSGIAEATYLGLWVPSFLLVGGFLESRDQ